MEWMSQAAIPLPAVVLSRLLGLPDEAAEFVRDFGYASGEQISGFASEERCREIQEIIGDLGPVVDAYGQARAAAHPDQNTVIGLCADAVTSGELNDLEAFVILLLLVSAGSESTTSLIGTGVSILARDQPFRSGSERIPHWWRRSLRRLVGSTLPFGATTAG